MCGGGGGYSPPPDNSLELERMRQTEADRNREREDAKAAQLKAEQEVAFGTNLGNAETSARNRAQRTLTQRGLNPQDYMSLIDGAIADQRVMVPQRDPNPAQYYTDDFINNVLMNEQAGKRSQYIRDVDKVYSPGFENNLINDTVDDPYIKYVLDKQRLSAQQQVDRAKARGNLDDTGYSGAMSRLDELYTAGTAAGQKLGGSVLQGYREKLRGVGDTARADAGRYELGGSFNPDVYNRQRDATYNNFTSNIEGDMLGALGGTNFFDIGDIITQGGITQGATNPRLAQPAVLAQRKEKQDAQRGLGGQGTF
jgi:hypothetical protein